MWLEKKADPSFIHKELQEAVHNASGHNGRSLLSLLTLCSEQVRMAIIRDITA